MNNMSPESQLLHTELAVEINDPDSDSTLEMSLLTALSAAAQCSPKGRQLLEDLTDDIVLDFFSQYSRVKFIF